MKNKAYIKIAPCFLTLFSETSIPENRSTKLIKNLCAIPLNDQPLAAVTNSETFVVSALLRTIKSRIVKKKTNAINISIGKVIFCQNSLLNESQK